MVVDEELVDEYGGIDVGKEEEGVRVEEDVANADGDGDVEMVGDE